MEFTKQELHIIGASLALAQLIMLPDEVPVAVALRERISRALCEGETVTHSGDGRHGIVFDGSGCREMTEDEWKATDDPAGGVTEDTGQHGDSNA